MPQPLPPIIRSLLGQTFSRSFTIERGQVNAEDRTVPLSFSSETPVERWYGLEILDHSPGAADLSRLNAGAAILVCHDRYDQVGAVVHNSASIGKDRIGRAVCLFSQSDRGKDIQTDVNDGIRGATSFRYTVREMVLESQKDDVDTYRVTKWEPLEISFEPIPADASVGAFRSREEELLQNLDPKAKRAALAKLAEREGFKLILSTDVRTDNPSRDAPPATPTNSPTQERTDMPAATNPTDTNPAAAADAVRTADQIRRDEIIELGVLAGQRELAVDLALEGKTVDEARTAIVAKRKASQTNTPPQTAEQIAARNEGTAAHVVSRVRLRNFTDQKEAFRFGQFLGGVLGIGTARTWCKENGFSLQRAHSESDNESGGIWLPHEFSETMILLREKFGLVRSFGDVEPMGTDRKTVRRQKKGLTAYPSGAKGVSRKVAQSQMEWDAIELVARKWKVTTKVEEELTEDATTHIGDKFAGESAYAFAKSEDDAFFNADGTSLFHGIVGLEAKLRKVHATIANIKGLTVASGNLFSEFIMGDFLKLVASLPDYADNENTAWYMHRTFFWNTIVPLMIAAGGTTVEQLENAPIKKFLSYPVKISQVLRRVDANSKIACYLGDIKLSTTFGDRMGMQVKQTDTNDDDWDNDLISMKATERYDINHHDVGDTVEAGPVVALISAAS